MCAGDGQELTVAHQYVTWHYENLCKFGFPDLNARISSTVLRKCLQNPWYKNAVSLVFTIITKTPIKQANLETWKV